jgi:hypothetical protein
MTLKIVGRFHWSNLPSMQKIHYRDDAEDMANDKDV